MEAQENNHDKIQEIFAHMIQHLPKSCCFSYSVTSNSEPVYNNAGQAIGMLPMLPEITFTVTGPVNNYVFGKFESIMKTSVYGVIDSRGFTQNRVEYLVTSVDRFIEEADKYYFWPMYSELFTKELEETISENPQKKV